MPPRRRTPWSPRLLIINAVLNTVTTLLFTIAVVVDHRDTGEINGWFVATGSVFAVSAVIYWVRWSGAVRERRRSDHQRAGRARPEDEDRTDSEAPGNPLPTDVAAPEPARRDWRTPPPGAPGASGTTGGGS